MNETMIPAKDIKRGDEFGAWAALTDAVILWDSAVVKAQHEDGTVDFCHWSDPNTYVTIRRAGA